MKVLVTCRGVEPTQVERRVGGKWPALQDQML